MAKIGRNAMPHLFCGSHGETSLCIDGVVAGNLNTHAEIIQDYGVELRPDRCHAKRTKIKTAGSGS